MIITCPSCGTRYKADAARFEPTGRNVRCAKCGHQWFQQPSEEGREPVSVDPSAEATTPPATPTIEASVSGAAAASASRSTLRARTGSYELGRAEAHAAEEPRAPWQRMAGIGAVLALAAVLVLGIVFRIDIVRIWPQSASVYRLVGVNINTENLWFENHSYEWLQRDGKIILVVRGDVVNLSEDAQPVPPVRVALRDGLEEELYHWIFTVDERSLDGNGRTTFEQWLASPPVEALDVVLSFVASGS